MSMRIIKSFNSPMPPREFSEDAIGHNGHAAWVIDGATGWSDHGVLVEGEPTDAAWYAHKLNLAFASLHARDNKISPSVMFLESSIQMCAQFMLASRINPARLAPHDLPSAAALHVSYDPELHALQFNGFADCIGIVKSGEKIIYVTPSWANAMGEEERVQLLREGKHTKEHEQAARAGMNNPHHPKPYWVLSIHPEAASHAWTQTITLPEAPVDVLIASDGLDRTRGLLGWNHGQLLDAVKTRGFEAVTGLLRCHERRNANTPNRMNIKTHDDVSGHLIHCARD